MSVQVVEKSGEGLSRVYGVTIPAQDLSSKLEAKIAEIGPQLKLKGFRPGKVPIAHVRRMYGRDLMREIVQEALNESSQQALSDAKVRPAASPDLKLTSDAEAVVKGEQDLSYDIEVEVMPDFQPVDVAGLALKRPTYEPSDADIDEALAEIVGQNKTYESKGGKAPTAAEGDLVVADFIGRIDGEAFEGGTAEDAEITIGSGRFIPGFEEQLKGAKTGETRTLNVNFPEDYNTERLKGKAAEFEVTVKDIRAPKDAQADDAFAERLGLSDLQGLRDALRRQLGEQYGQASRFKLKRALLDELDKAHDFPLPPRMVEAEYEVIWQQVKADLDAGRLGDEDKDKPEAQLQAEYRRIAERRVRLGLILAEIGRANDVTVSDAELNQAIMNEARRYPGQERAVFDFYRQNPQAGAQLRAPVYEEKVVELIFGKAKVEDQPVSKDELLADDEMPDGYEDAAPEEQPKAKAKTKKAASADAPGAGDATPAPAKKPRAKKAAE